jgi:ribosomal protein S18 acetylase RimI-like enzyme
LGLLPCRNEAPVSELTIDLAEPSDAVAVENLLDAAADWQQKRGIEQWTPGWFEDEVREGIALGQFYAARREGSVVGCFLLDGCPSWMRPWLMERDREPSQATHLGCLAVAPEATGQGLGVELLNMASRLAAGRGFAHVRLDCPAENARLRRYYSDAGFTHVGDVKTRGPNGEHWVSSVFERATGVES